MTGDLADRIGAARAALAPRPDPVLGTWLTAARATLGDTAARTELEYRPAKQRSRDLARAARTTYACGSCAAIIRGPEARCRKCGSENTVNASGRAKTIR